MAKLGRPRKTTVPPPEVLETSPEATRTLVELLAKVSPERRERLIDALFEAATGAWAWAGEKPPRGLGDKKQVRVIDLATNEESTGWIVLRPPDSRAAQLLLEHSAGKPHQRFRRFVR